MIAFFDDHNSAMVNSNLPETQAFGDKQLALLEAPPTFAGAGLAGRQTVAGCAS